MVKKRAWAFAPLQSQGEYSSLLVSKPSSLRSDIETEREAQGGWQCQPC